MRRLAVSITIATTLWTLNACVPGHSGSGNDKNPNPQDPTMNMDPDPSDQNPQDPQNPTNAFSSLSIEPAEAHLAIAEEATFHALAIDVTGKTIDVSDRVTWTSSDETLLAPVTDQVGRFKAIATGGAEARATLDALAAKSMVTITGPSAMPLALHLSTAELTIAVTASADATAELEWSDGTRTDVTSVATWSSSNNAAVTVSAGHVTRVAAGTASIEVSHLGLSASINVKEPAPPCTYPTGTPRIGVGDLMPNVSWTGAYMPDGTTTSLSLENIHCDTTFADKTIIIFDVGAAWCQPCTQYSRELDSQADAIEAAGAVIIFVEAQQTNGDLPDSTYANDHLENNIGVDHGYRVGDGDTMPTAGTFNNSPLTTQFPTALVVRKSDMKIILNQAEWNDVLPYSQIALHPDADWSHPNQPPQAPNCGPADEEMGEPNNTSAQATAVQAGSFMAGICDSEGDFYSISHPGDWRLDLTFSHAVGDIDVYVWDTQADQRLEMNGQPVGSESGDDDESFTYHGPATVKVLGYRGATAPYTFTLTTM